MWDQGVGATYNGVNNKERYYYECISYYIYHYHNMITTLKHRKVNDSPKVTQQCPCFYPTSESYDFTF